MGLEFFTIDDAAAAPLPGDRFDDGECLLLEPWARACREAGLGVGLPLLFADSHLPVAELAPALRLLDEEYRRMTGRSVLGQDPAAPEAPYRRMARLIERGLDAGLGLAAWCD
ncbi:MAG TPA: hypothetical protein VGE07_11015 [Herpetosiphonaceae bacterium]